MREFVFFRNEIISCRLNYSCDTFNLVFATTHDYCFSKNFFYRRKDINFRHYLHYFKQCQWVHSRAWRVVLIHWHLKSFVPSEEPIELTVQKFQISEVNKNTILQGHFLLQIPNFVDIKNRKTDSPGRNPLSKFAHKSRGNKPLSTRTPFPIRF